MLLDHFTLNSTSIYTYSNRCNQRVLAKTLDCHSNDLYYCGSTTYGIPQEVLPCHLYYCGQPQMEVPKKYCLAIYTTVGLPHMVVPKKYCLATSTTVGLPNIGVSQEVLPSHLYYCGSTTYNSYNDTY